MRIEPMAGVSDHHRAQQSVVAGTLALALIGGLTGCTGRAAELVADPAREAPRRPNLLLIITDDQRFDAIGALGNPQIRTPNLDRLVAAGTAFTNAYILGSHHGAVCMPSRAMLLTGRHYFNLPDSVTAMWQAPAGSRGDCPFITFPEHFRRAGYTTFGVGKWHNGRGLYARGFAGGANIFFGGMADHLAVPVHDFDPTGAYPPKQAHRGEKFSSELFTDPVVDFLQSRTADEPFLVYLAYTAPHDPRMAPVEFAQMYRPDDLPLPANFMPEHPFPMGDLRIRDEKLAPFPRTEAVVREHIAAYYAMISHLDAQIGRILDALAATGQDRNTVIVFAGDNGLAVGQHGLLGKQNIYEHSVRIPLILAGPGVPAGRRCDGLVYLRDVFPTICELSGLPTPDSVQTRSLVPLLEGGADGGRSSVFLAYSSAPGAGAERPPGILRGVRSGRWKLILCNYGGSVTTLLFDLNEDPWEMNNLADDPAHADRLRTLTALLRQWIIESGDRVDLDRPDWGFGASGP
jgi:arylsulfatase A-like enzyme